MTSNAIKNLGVSVLFSLLLIYELVLNYSLLGIAGAVLAIGVILLAALIYGKDLNVVEKLDIYIFVWLVSIPLIRHEQLVKAMMDNTDAVATVMENLGPVFALVIGAVLYFVLGMVSKKVKSLAAAVINKYVGKLSFAAGVFVFLHPDLKLHDMIVIVMIYSLFAIIDFCRTGQKYAVGLNKRPSLFAMLLAALYILMSVICPGFSITGSDLNIYLSTVVFPWYVVLFLSLILATIIGLGLYFGDRVVDVDTVFLTGVIGLIWVLKAAMSFYFLLSWMMICVYTLIMLGVVNHFVNHGDTQKQICLDPKQLFKNELSRLLAIAAAAVAAAYLIHTGYVLLCGAILLGVFMALFLRGFSSGWQGDAISWISILFGIGISMCAFAGQCAFSIKKVALIAIMFAVSAVAMWMVNYRNRVGRNKYRFGKPAMALMFALLALIVSARYRADISIKTDEAYADNGYAQLGVSQVEIKADPTEKGSVISNVKYIWTDSFIYSKDDICSIGGRNEILTVDGRHLIVWSEDSNGIITRADKWFYIPYAEE